MFCWTPESIRFRREAAEYVGFDAKIAERIAERLPQGASVCDAGCGLGYMSLALARKGFHVTAVDSSAEALAVLRENAAKEFLPNLTIVQDDVFTMRPQKRYDAMVFCFFGRTDETLAAVRAQCSGTAFLVKKNWEYHRFVLREKRLERFTFPITCAELTALRVPYTSTTFPVEMGQPFRSLADAVRFFSLYNEGDASIQEGQIAERLVAADSEEFPWYCPSRLPVGLIQLDAGKLPTP